MFSITSCFEDLDDNLVITGDVKDFIWKGMNYFYIYGNDVPNLRNETFGISGLANRYDTTQEYEEFLSGFSSPEELFDALVFDAGNTDRFSTIFPDLFQAIDLFNGTSETNGMRRLFGFQINGNGPFYVRVGLVLNGSNADLAGVERNMIISGVDGTAFTSENAQSLLSQSSMTLNFADYNDNGTEDTSDDSVTPNGQTATVTREVFTDNPVHRTEVITTNGETIGYIMYNSFRDNFETELNNAFAQLQAANVEHLVLDLRYNGGGAIVTAARLATMISGESPNQVFSKAFFGPNRLEQNRDFNFDNTISSGAAVNTLNFEKVYVLTTGASASASELIINSLRPYIDVVQIGDITTGKTTINTLVFDSPDFSTQQVTNAHTYAMLPLIGDSTNKDEELVPPTGLVPDIILEETFVNLGTLGDPNEPLLARAIMEITNADRFTHPNPSNSNNLLPLKLTTNTESLIDGYMYIK
ncbi:S41 family peptidase [Winogradskyella sp.]|uniref:S41 family peptidase n=1 Tax=Winogradskyella sp. TaxID=1883156 RepID=UPI0025EEA16D|nr:S41 family peptidase [Winogradskyella sp.]